MMASLAFAPVAKGGIDSLDGNVRPRKQTKNVIVKGGISAKSSRWNGVIGYPRDNA